MQAKTHKRTEAQRDKFRNEVKKFLEQTGLFTNVYFVGTLYVEALWRHHSEIPFIRDMNQATLGSFGVNTQYFENIQEVSIALFRAVSENAFYRGKEEAKHAIREVLGL